MYSQKAGMYDNVAGKENHHRVKLGEFYFDLVMHPESLKPPQRGQKSKRGNHIRTLYPKFRGRKIPGQTVATNKVDLPTQPHNNAPIQIVSAMPNPKSPDDRDEWVELKNQTENTTFDLANWKLSDRNGRQKTMKGSLCLLYTSDAADE